MRKVICAGVVILVCFSFSSCGDNKTTEKLIGAQVITGTADGSGTGSSNNNSSDPSVTAVTKAANMASQACAMGKGIGIPAQMVLATVKRIGGQLPEDTDGDGWREYANVSSVIKIQLLNASDKVLSDAEIFTGTAIKKIKAKITSTYSYGAWSGEFEVVRDSGGNETMSGTINSADPVGTTFTETLTGITMDQTTISGQPISIPKSGSSSLTSTGGYTGTFTYTNPATDVYKHEGIITAQGKTVATVYLTFNKTFGNYTGYYLDGDGVRQEIN